jgi:transcriptional regulator with XRE-family HTH domain
MSSRARRTGAALGAAAVLALGAYAVGSAAGDGSAEAARSSSQSSDERAGRHRGPDLEAIAEQLGVSVADLRSALEAVREGQAPGDRRAMLAADLAEALDIPEGRVTQALEAQHDARKDAFATALAEALDLEVDDVRAALDEVRPEEGTRPGRRGRRGFETALARELGVSRAKLRAALREARPERGERGRGPAQDIAALADALGVEEDRLEAAFEQIRANAEARREERHEAFVQALAERLDVSADAVREAFPAPPAGGPGHGRGGPGGPGFGPPPGGRR